jgi:RimJ/RimL family protein N-acetyltransferase
MIVSLTKKLLLGELPIGEGPLTIRAWTRNDLDTLAAWPRYPFPYEGFSFVSMNSEERDKLFRGVQAKSNALPLVVDHTNQPAIGYIALTRIGWSERRVGNFGFRIHPDWVDKGVGTSVLCIVCLWLFNCGTSSIGVDVAVSNARAVRCYEKVGFYKVGEMWRKAQDLKGVDITGTRYDFLRPHLRQDGEVPELRFFLMEITPKTNT